MCGQEAARHSQPSPHRGIRASRPPTAFKSLTLTFNHCSPETPVILPSLSDLVQPKCLKPSDLVLYHVPLPLQQATMASQQGQHLWGSELQSRTTSDPAPVSVMPAGHSRAPQGWEAGPGSQHPCLGIHWSPDWLQSALLT